MTNANKKPAPYTRKRKSLNEIDRENGISATNSSSKIHNIMVAQLKNKGIKAPDDSGKEKIYEYRPGAPKFARPRTIIFKSK